MVNLSPLGEIRTNRLHLMVKCPALTVAFLPAICIIKFRMVLHMKYETVSLNTKRMLSAALKDAMKSKPLSKITVSEIIRKCGVNRKTFYYHFSNIYELLKWTLEQEAVEVVKNFDLMVNAEDAVSFVIDYVSANQHILNCAYDSMGRNEMRRFFYADFIHITSSVIDRAEAVAGLQVDFGFKKFLAEFYTEALAGMLINMFTGNVKYERADIQENIILFLKTAIPNALQAKSGGSAREIPRPEP